MLKTIQFQFLTFAYNYQSKVIMKKILLVAIVLCASYAGMSQQTVSDTDVPKNSRLSETSEPVSPVSASEYNFQEKKILKCLIDDTAIPESVPKFDAETMTDEQYVEILKQWARENLDLIKEEFQEKL